MVSKLSRRQIAPIVSCLKKYFQTRKNRRFLAFPSLELQPQNIKVNNELPFQPLK